MHTTIDYLQDLGSEVAPSFKLTEIIELQNGTLASPLYLSMYRTLHRTLHIRGAGNESQEKCDNFG